MVVDVTVQPGSPITLTLAPPAPIALTLVPPVATVLTLVPPAPVAVTLTTPAPVAVTLNPVGIAGPAGNRVTVTAKANINAGAVVAVDPDNLARPASSSTATDAERVVGVAATSALVGESFPVVTVGDLLTAATFTVGPLYLAVDGSLTTDPATGLFTMRVANAATGTRLVVRISSPIFYP